MCAAFPLYYWDEGDGEMLKNRVDKLVLKALLEADAPAVLAEADGALAKRFVDDFRSIVNRLLMGRSETIELFAPPLNREDKAAVNNLITRLPDGDAKRELVFYYRLAILAETVVVKYSV